MRFYTIPVSAIPNQTLETVINNNKLTISLNTRFNSKLYATIFKNGKAIIRNRLCLNATPLVSVEYLGMDGNLFFIDKNGSDDPHYKELGSRYLLVFSEVNNE